MAGIATQFTHINRAPSAGSPPAKLERTQPAPATVHDIKVRPTFVRLPRKPHQAA